MVNRGRSQEGRLDIERSGTHRPRRGCRGERSPESICCNKIDHRISSLTRSARRAGPEKSSALPRFGHAVLRPGPIPTSAAFKKTQNDSVFCFVAPARRYFYFEPLPGTEPCFELKKIREAPVVLGTQVEKGAGHSPDVVVGNPLKDGSPDQGVRAQVKQAAGPRRDVIDDAVVAENKGCFGVVDERERYGTTAGAEGLRPAGWGGG